MAETEKQVDGIKRLLLVEAVAEAVTHSEDGVMWRDRDKASRDVARELAESLIARLEDAGVKMTTNPKKLEVWIDELLTIPAAKAFEPGQ